MKCFDYRKHFVLYEKQRHNGALIFTAWHRVTDNRTKQIYHGYTVAQAKQEFKRLLTRESHAAW